MPEEATACVRNTRRASLVGLAKATREGGGGAAHEVWRALQLRAAIGDRLDRHLPFRVDYLELLKERLARAALHVRLKAAVSQPFRGLAVEYHIELC